MGIKSKTLFLLIMMLSLSACIRPPVHSSSAAFDRYSFDDIWTATLRALHDIDFLPYSIDRRAGVIAAEAGRSFLLYDLPPQISLVISRAYGKTYVDCKVSQLDNYVDVFRLNRKITRKFYSALNGRLRHIGEQGLL